LIAYKYESNVRVTDRLKKQLVLDVTRFGIFAPKKLAARRQIKE
jgi:hypothetical protein